MKMQELHMKILGPHRMALVHGRQVMVLHMKVRRKEEHHTLWRFPHWEQEGTRQGARKSQGEGGEHLDVRDEVDEHCEVEYKGAR